MKARISRKLPVTKFELAKLLSCGPFYVMLTLLVVEALLAATVTYQVIQAGRDIANDEFLIRAFAWILGVQALSYLVGTVSWVYAEQAGFGAYGRYMHHFARANFHSADVLGEKPQREVVEPFLTSETFHIFFELMYELEADLKMLFGLIFNSIVLGMEIDAGFPVAFALIFVVCMAMQYSVRKKVSGAYLENQRMTNRMTAHSYTAWDNIFSGNRYNYSLWNRGFKNKLRDALKAQIRAILWREGLSTASGIIGLAIIFAVMAWVAFKDVTNTSLLIALAATLPRQIDMTHEVHSLASGWNDLLAIWTRIGGAVEHFKPAAETDFKDRIKFENLVLKEGDFEQEVGSVYAALALIGASPTGRINVRGSNGAGKSTLLAALKAELKNKAYYWPTTDRLSYQFADGNAPEADEVLEDDENGPPTEVKKKRKGFSAGERQMRSLREIVENTGAQVYLLDEWDANLDKRNRESAYAMVDRLAARARVVEISHRDRA